MVSVPDVSIMMMSHVGTWILLLALGLFLPQAMPPASPAVQNTKPTSLVVGQVVDAGTNRPIPGAVVSINAGHRILADDQGRFLFRDLAKGSYLFTASAPGYLDGGYGRRRPNSATQP